MRGFLAVAVSAAAFADVSKDGSGVGSVAALGDPDNVAERISGYELWGMRPKRIAVVNPVLGEEPGTTLDLSGEWEFTQTRNFTMRYMFVNRFQMTGCFLPDIHTHILLRLFNILQGGIMLQYRSYEQNKES